MTCPYFLDNFELACNVFGRVTKGFKNGKYFALLSVVVSTVRASWQDQTLHHDQQLEKIHSLNEELGIICKKILSRRLHKAGCALLPITIRWTFLWIELLLGWPDSCIITKHICKQSSFVDLFCSASSLSVVEIVERAGAFCPTTKKNPSIHETIAADHGRQVRTMKRTGLHISFPFLRQNYVLLGAYNPANHKSQTITNDLILGSD